MSHSTPLLQECGTGVSGGEVYYRWKVPTKLPRCSPTHSLQTCVSPLNSLIKFVVLEMDPQKSTTRSKKNWSCICCVWLLDRSRGPFVFTGVAQSSSRSQIGSRRDEVFVVRKTGIALYGELGNWSLFGLRASHSLRGLPCVYCLRTHTSLKSDRPLWPVRGYVPWLCLRTVL